MNCKNCNNKLTFKIADLGFSPPSNSFLKDLEHSEIYYPLKVYLCEKCLLVQINEYKNAKEIFSKDYVYFSSYSNLWVNHAKNYASMIKKILNLDSNSQVIEIACNDGYLLQFFRDMNSLGIEPTTSTASVARNKGIKVIEDFFDSNLAKSLPKANLIIGNNVLAHIPNIRDFIKGVRIALKEDGVANFEFPHILNLIKYNQFDTIYHEHFYYYSLHSVMNLFENENMYIYDIDLLDTHGGSLRIYASKVNKKISKKIQKILLLEKQYKLDSKDGYIGLQKNMQNLKNKFLSLLLRLYKQNKKVVAYGAAAKGNTILNYCGIKDDLILYAVDSSPHKQNLFLPGSHIKVLSPSYLKEIVPDYIWIPAWNVSDEIISNVKEIVKIDCKFIITTPKLHIINV
ncbi:SAM-dependent methyltransferase [Helicobacter sp. MIT 14-3879]|nr:SAM-dependent methyltransferase [Helicobacter sp. MIT 14-3879]